MERGDVWWAELGEPSGLSPGWRRPVVVVQSDAFNRSRIGTVVVATMTSNLSRAEAPGNVIVRVEETGLDEDSVVNVSQLVTLDKRDLVRRVGRLHFGSQAAVDEGIRLVLSL